MSRRAALAAAILVLCSAACRTGAPARRAGGMSSSEFRALLQRVADGWNAGDARRAADCFSVDAAYEEPPAKQLYHGREALFAFFGGAEKLPMSMTWHHVAFDEASQTGFGEYTFKLNKQLHGVVVVRVRGGLITHWREYQYESNLPFDRFARETAF